MTHDAQHRGSRMSPLLLLRCCWCVVVTVTALRACSPAALKQRAPGIACVQPVLSARRLRFWRTDFIVCTTSPTRFCSESRRYLDVFLTRTSFRVIFHAHGRGGTRGANYWTPIHCRKPHRIPWTSRTILICGCTGAQSTGGLGRMSH